MQLLVDTQAIIWFQTLDNKLSATAKSIIENPENRCLISIASLWEMAIKVALKKLHLEIEYDSFPEYLLGNQFEILNIDQVHLNTVSRLPHHHKDPFDRLLIAQAITENISIISADHQFKSYPINVIW